MPSNIIRSPLRYPGGKTRAINQILPLVPDTIREFREPFVGGGSVLFAMFNEFGAEIDTYWINDLHYDLFCFWTFAKSNNDDLVDAVANFKAAYQDGRELYEYLRSDDYGNTNFERAVRFFIMNRITFSGVMDSGGYSSQSFKGRFTDSSIERLSVIDEVLNHVQVTHGDYEPLLTASGDDVFIFLDPPYYSAADSKLYGVKGDLHTTFDHDRFARDMRACNHRWLITLDDSPYIRELFDFAEIVEWELQYGMNNYKQDKAAKGREIFVKNY